MAALKGRHLIAGDAPAGRGIVTTVGCLIGCPIIRPVAGEPSATSVKQWLEKFYETAVSRQGPDTVLDGTEVSRAAGPSDEDAIAASEWLLDNDLIRDGGLAGEVKPTPRGFGICKNPSGEPTK